MKKSQKAYLPLKRLIAFFGSIAGILFCAAFLWWWVFPINLFVTKGHPFFVQERYGKHKKIFKMLKFRSMKLEANSNLAPSEMNEDTQKSMETKFGSFLRKTSIDETPQLFNIFLGQMSFIGPRPGSAHNEEALVVEREKYTPNAFDVKPGLGGLAQHKLLREHDPDGKAYYDHLYVKQISLWEDIKLFVCTILGIFGLLKGK